MERESDEEFSSQCPICEGWFKGSSDWVTGEEGTYCSQDCYKVAVSEGTEEPEEAEKNPAEANNSNGASKSIETTFKMPLEKRKVNDFLFGLLANAVTQGGVI